MEKIKFAIQVVSLILAFPVYFYAEITHGAKKPATTESHSIHAQTCYTKNGKAKMHKVTALPGATIYTNTIFVNSF